MPTMTIEYELIYSNYSGMINKGDRLRIHDGVLMGVEKESLLLKGPSSEVVESDYTEAILSSPAKYKSPDMMDKKKLVDKIMSIIEKSPSSTRDLIIKMKIPSEDSPGRTKIRNTVYELARKNRIEKNPQTKGKNHHAAKYRISKQNWSLDLTSSPEEVDNTSVFDEGSQDAA